MPSQRRTPPQVTTCGIRLVYWKSAISADTKESDNFFTLIYGRLTAINRYLINGLLFSNIPLVFWNHGTGTQCFPLTCFIHSKNLKIKIRPFLSSGALGLTIRENILSYLISDCSEHSKAH